MLQFDLSAFEKRARELGGALDQVPFALAGALNDAAEVTRRRLIEETWPKGVTVRSRNFMAAALSTGGQRATKASLRVTIYDKLGRAHLVKHATGGTKQARGRLAIPSKRIAAERGAAGVPKRLRPTNLKRSVVKGNMIFIAEGRGKNSKLRLAYSLRPAAKIRKTVDFYEDFRATMAAEMRQAFGPALARAMSTRRPR